MVAVHTPIGVGGTTSSLHVQAAVLGFAQRPRSGLRLQENLRLQEHWLRPQSTCLRDRRQYYERRQSADLMRPRSQLDDSEKKQTLQLYGQIERVIADTAKRTSGSNIDPGRWKKIQDAWVLKPSQKGAVAVVHFIGGVFVGATPQLTYRLFLERLCERGLIIIATPYASGFDHMKIADEAQFKFDRCLRTLRDDPIYQPSVETLPVFGVGHSLGALTHLLIGARYAVQRQGNVIMSFNNKSASSAVPLLSPVIAPMAQNFGPLLKQLTASPALRLGAEMALKQMKQFQSVSPPLFQQVMPLLEQLPPLYEDLANGKDQFVPAPEETDRLIKTYYGVRRNLLIKFQNDSIDETPRLAQTLAQKSAVSSFLDLSVRTLPGDHATPCLQVFPEVPEAMASTLNRGTEMFSTMAAGTPWADLAKGLSNPAAQMVRERTIATIDSLVDEIANWIISTSQ